MNKLVFALFILVSSTTLAAQSFRFTFTEFAGENLYAIEGMPNTVALFYCPNYNNISIIRKTDGTKLLDFKASNCEALKNYIALNLMSGAKPYVVYSPFEEMFSRWGVTNSREGLCRQ